MNCQPGCTFSRVDATLKPPRWQFMKLALIASLFVLLSGCPGGFINDDDSGYSYKPVYLSYDDLRQSVNVQQPRSVVSVGRIYLFGNYFFLNERNVGIHMFDNTDPTTPINTAFITVPGNTEISIKDGFLYADSFVDLVTLDINNPADIKVTSRTNGIFPWDAYQAVDDFVFFGYDQLDESRGVITGYE